MLLKAYFPPHEPVWELPSEHPLLNSLLVEPDNLREQIIEIIKKSEPKPVRDGMKTLEQFYMGQLMKELRGRVDASRAREIIREEAAALLDIVPPPKKGGRYEVRFKSGI
jgi:Glu-tRNA(Gln) amidotransferase subunit E-like FAD-binding protein